MKTYITVAAAVLVLILLAGGAYFYMSSGHTSGKIACTQEAKLCPDGSSVGRSGPNCEFALCPSPKMPADPKNTTYIIEGNSVTLVNGRAEVESAPGAASKTVTQYFGNDATGDMNGDGIPDVAFILTQSGGGSGTFYYAVAALKTPDGYHGTNAILLGDRIAPQTTAIKNGQMIVNYADRKAGEPMTAQPSAGMSKHLKIQGTTLEEVLPVTVVGAGAGEHCGGNMRTALQCVAGYHCAPTPGSHLPFGDVGGTCIAD